MGLLESPQEILIAHSSFRYIKSNILISTIRVFNRMQSLKTNTKTITMVMLALCTMCVVQIHGVDPNDNESEPKRRRLGTLKYVIGGLATYAALVGGYLQPDVPTAGTAVPQSTAVT